MKQKLIVISVLFVLMAASAEGQNVRLSVAGAVQQGLKNNPEIQNAALGKQKSQSEHVGLKSKLYPQIQAYSDFSYFYALPKMIVPGELFGQGGDTPVEFGTKYNWNSGFKATQLLYNQSYFTALRVAGLQTGLEQLNLQQKKENLVYQITQLYYLCQTTRQQREHLSVTAGNMSHLLQITGLLHQNELIRKIDHDQVLVDQNNLQREIDNLDQLFEQQLNLMKFLIGIEAEASIELTDSLAFSVREVATLMPSWENRTEMKMLNSQFEMASLSLKQGKQEYLPVLSGYAQYYYQGQRDRFDFFDGGDNRFFNVGGVGLSLSIPVFDGFERREKIQQRKLTMQQLRNRQMQTVNYLTKEHVNASLQYDNNRKAVVRQKENIGIAEKNYRIALLGYEQQTISLTDLLRAQNSLTESRLTYANALLQFKNAELDLIRSKGGLLIEYINQ